MANIKIEPDVCKSCGYCIKVCPKQVLATTGKVNRFGYKYVEPVHLENCIACGMCAMMCPDGAIEIYK